MKKSKFTEQQIAFALRQAETGTRVTDFFYAGEIGFTPGLGTEHEGAYHITGWRSDKAEVYCDQYICSGGQLAEIALGRDRMVIDLRPRLHRAIGYDSTLCCRPYDLCTALIAREAGCVVTAADGRPLDAPLDTSTNLDFAAYANSELAAKIQPILNELLATHGLAGR